MSFSMFGEDSPRSIQLPDNYLVGRNSPVVVEQNVSYTRGNPTHGVQQSLLPLDPRRLPNRFRNHSEARENGNGNGNGNDEDARFLRLAHEALVATTAKLNMLVDPTIEDLLTRLQYALLPHGNPIKRSQNITANENGQLMIQNFYDGFPNMSNDIFTGTHNHPLNSNNSGWNFLLDEEKKKSEIKQEPEEEEDKVPALDRKNKLQRKFPCPDCDMLFRRSSDLKRHGKQHLEIPANICPSCGKGFARRDALKRHQGTLTCKRNELKGLYEKNLTYLREQQEDKR
ncbi:hypothetical protein C7M61_000151 [Candidozyma pseudohaemuli]|uniref:C2H2-type domain-containing protein n=1 Tax=Candidozyma pseudohaemuli TaxID=418784 RepID=A0A2P7YX04_9ASCO|nr:hypothetical protein C7M61_000151 [[Candida] pseudohaemulonii]PSK40506.1 hypothetical protein C7M61_000151 [[Candida] pseudohaemulonii]